LIIAVQRIPFVGWQTGEAQFGKIPIFSSKMDRAAPSPSGGCGSAAVASDLGVLRLILAASASSASSSPPSLPSSSPVPRSYPLPEEIAAAAVLCSGSTSSSIYRRHPRQEE